MSKKVLLAAFKKAEKEINSSKKTHQAQHLADYLMDNFKHSIDERTLRDYFNKYLKNDTNDKRELKPQTTRFLCNYLGYENFVAFSNANRTDHEDSMTEENDNVEERIERDVDSVNNIEDENETNKSPNRTITITVLSLFIFFLIYVYIRYGGKQTACMNWVEDHYEKVICEETSYPQIALNKDLLENFKRVTLDTTMVFFENGKPLYYYDRTDGTVEFFNQKGVHPIHGDSLRPITETIVRKYVYLEE